MDEDEGDLRAASDIEASGPYLAPPPGGALRQAMHPAARRGRAAIVWLLLLAVAAGIVLILVPRLEKKPSRGRFVPPVPVAVARVRKGDMPLTFRALGTVTPLATVTVRTQINGRLTRLGFREGQTVKAGDFLAQIDPRPYEVALAAARAQLARDEALLANARADLARYNRLIAEKSIARQTRDTQASLVAQYAATVEADEAQIDTQKLNLRYAHIVAPISGRVGLRQVDPGNYLQPSDANGIVVITQMQPISVLFALPQGDLPQVLKQLHARAKLPVSAYDGGSNTLLAQGTLAAVDNQIDPTTGTVKLRADFANRRGMLFPNQFVNIRLVVDTLRGVALVPPAAVQHGAPGNFVYLVKPDDTVAVRVVKLGPASAAESAVLSGLAPGDRVVTDGIDRLHAGSKVTIAGAPAATPGG